MSKFWKEYKDFCKTNNMKESNLNSLECFVTLNYKFMYKEGVR